MATTTTISELRAATEFLSYFNLMEFAVDFTQGGVTLKITGAQLKTMIDSLSASGGTINGNLSIAGDLEVEGDTSFDGVINCLKVLIGEAIDSMTAGKGIIAENGRMQLDNLEVRNSMTVMELLVNRLSAIEGDQVLTEGDTIESVEDLGDSCYGLTLKSKWDGYFTAQTTGAVIKGTINSLSAGGGTYHTSWMRINSVNTANNYIEVTLYDDDDVPGGSNFQPCELMNIVRWGHQTDTTRQSCLYLSSTEGRIVKLTGVTKPILENYNYGATFGTVPEFLSELDLPLIEGQDYAYMRGLIVEDIIRVDYQGRPISEIVDRGVFTEDASYYSEARNPATNRYEISDVWHLGCKWRCLSSLTTDTPAWNSTDWAMIEGNPDFTVSFEDVDYLFDPDTFAVTLTIVAKLYNQVVTADILDADVEWTRYSEDANGTERVASDNAWALKRGGEGKSIDLTTEDCDFNGYVPKTLRFTAKVTLRDGMTDTVTFGY